MDCNLKIEKIQTKDVISGLKRIKLPKYTLGEELISSISHGAGALLGVAALVLCVERSIQHHNIYGVVSSWVFGFSLIILYLMSCIYHSLRPNDAKRVMRICDHCTIFLLIAGTYTPYTLVALRGKVGWSLFGIVWAAAIIGIVLNAIDMQRFQKLSMICYLAMGWVIVFAFSPLTMAVIKGGIVLLVAGGIAYTIGAIIYGIGSKVRYMHSVWHFFVLAGSILHFLSIYLYVL